MSLYTQRLLASIAWIGFFLIVYLASPAPGLQLFASMLAVSLVGLAFGVSWFVARNWIEDRIPPEEGRLRSFKWAQMAIWMGALLVYSWVAVVLHVVPEAGFVGLVTVFVTPVWFGVTKMLAPRSAQPAP